MRLNDKVGMNDQLAWHSVASLHKSMVRTEGEREKRRESNLWFGYLGLVDGDGCGVVGQERAVRVDHPAAHKGVEVGRGRRCGSDGFSDLGRRAGKERESKRRRIEV